MTWLVQSFTTGLLKGLLNTPASDSPDKSTETESKTDDAALKVIQQIPNQGLKGIKPDIFNNFESTKTSAGVPQFGNRVLVGSRQETGELTTMCCNHNGRGETTSTDIVEHVLNGEYGSAARDAAESRFSDNVQEAVKDVLDAVGNEALRSDD